MKEGINCPAPGGYRGLIYDEEKIMALEKKIQKEHGNIAGHGGSERRQDGI